MTTTEELISSNYQGIQTWHNTKGLLHRQTGPAIIYPGGGQEWWLYGKLHRQDGPAIIGWNGDQFWYLHDKLHRLTGPAVIWLDGTQTWHIHGRNITQEVEAWMTENNITYPWDAHTQVEFVLRWG
jgi:hypothetical protein